MALSPMMQHYMRMKEQYKDCLLFYRLGDFYEMFFDDAVAASKELELTLTGRDCGLEERAPMCGVPFHAVDNYLAKLVAKGYKVAICEQLSEPVKGSMVERDVVRIVTSGTITDGKLLDDRANNYIAAVFSDETRVGIAWCDLSTGEFNFNQYDDRPMQQLSDALVRISPVEIICNEPMLAPSYDLPCVKALLVPKFGIYRSDAWDYESCKARVSALAGAETGNGKAYAVCAAGALMSYLSDTQKQSIKNIGEIDLEDDTQYMYLDAGTRRNLELTAPMHDIRGNKGTLLWLMDRTVTSMGRRQLRRMIEQPCVNLNVIKARQDCVEELVGDSVLLAKLRDVLSPVLDIERLSANVAYHRAGPKDLGAIRDSLRVLPELKNTLAACESGLGGLVANLDTMSELTDVLSRALGENLPHVARDGGFVAPNYCAELDEARSVESEAAGWLAQLEQREKEETGIRTLRVGFNRVFGYYIEVSKSQTEQVPFRYQRKQTTVNGERYITQELKELEEKILGGKERALAIELQIFDDLVSRIESEIVSIQRTAKMIATADCFASLALIAAEYNYVRPEVSDDGLISIKDGRHPTIERMSELFVPNDTVLDDSDNRIMIITGPNMAGKSTYMRQVALIVIMAHIGSFVPAQSAHIALTDRVFTRIGASDDLLTGHSTFMVEMLEVANILDNATDKSLLLLDEIGRGTSTYDGLSIAWAVMEYLSVALRAKTLFSTHYHELTDLEQRLEGVKNYRITVKEIGNSIVFLHKIARGSAMRSFGIEVASLAGVNDTVVARAKVILSKLKNNDINKVVADRVTEQQTSMFEAVSLKGYSEIKDILTGLDLDNMTPMRALETLADLVDRAKE